MTNTSSLTDQKLTGDSTVSKATTTAKAAAAAHSAVDIAAANLEKAEQALREARAAAGETAGDAAREAQRYSEEAVSSVKHYVHEKPLQSVGIALAAGYLLAVIMRR